MLQRSMGLFAIAALLGLLALSGCGGGGSDSTATSGPVASAEGDGGENGAEGGSGSTTAKPAGKGKDGGSEGSAGAGESSGGQQGGGSKGGQSGGSSGGGSGKGGSRGGAGSGGGSGSAFISEADAICTKARGRIHKEVEAALSNSDFPTLVRKIVTPGLEGEQRDIRALNAPASAAAAENGVISALQKMIDESEAAPEKFVLQGKAVIESEKLARSLGFKSCGALV